MSSEHQTIISLRAENTKRLSAVEIHADGRPLICIGGRNAQGKSSVLDALCWAFTGKKSLPDQPIRQGADRATILVRTQDYLVERRITPGGSTVAVRAADGSKLTSPQAILDKLTSDIAFDPVRFLQGKPKQQAAELAELTGIDLSAMEQERAELYGRRTDLNRRAKEAEAKAGAGSFARDLPDEEVSVSDLVERIQQADRQAQHRKRVMDNIEGAREKVRRIQEQIAALQADIEKTTAQALEWKDELEQTAEIEDTDGLREQLQNAEQFNAAIRARAASEEAAAEAARYKAQAEKCTAAMADIDAKKARSIAEAKLPVEGLGFDGEQVTLHGVPLSQASSAEQLRVSVAVALAQRPGLRVAIIRDGSLLDPESLALVAGLVAQYGGQCWVERVGAGEEVSVVIEDGMVSDDRLGAPADPEEVPGAGVAADSESETVTAAPAERPPEADLSDLF